jgi:PKD repeat protein
LSYSTSEGEGLEATYRIVVAILLAGLLAQTVGALHSVEASNAYFSVNTFPNPYSASAVGEKFDVNVTVYQLSSDSSYYDASFELSYNSTVIRVSSYALAPLWGTYSVSDAAGTLQVDVSSPSGTPIGNVLLITIQFVVLIQGLVPVEYTSPLHLFNTQLLGTSGEIPTGSPVDGLVTVAPRSPAPLAVFTWHPSTPGANQTVTFDGTGSAPGWNGTGYSPIVNYAWNFGDGNFTSGDYPTILHTYATIGNYTVNLNVTDTDGYQANDAHVVSVQSVLLGDINRDGAVNILDAVLLANSFLAKPGSSNWNPNADLNGDGAVNILDAIILANHFLEQYH